MSALSEADTRAKLIDPAIHARGWTEDLMKEEVSAGAIAVENGNARRRSCGRGCRPCPVGSRPGAAG